jgi:predicted Zn-dependent peptidase
MVAIGFVALAFASASAQQAPGPSTEGLVRKDKAPISTDILNVKLPRPQEADLANGLHLMVLEDRRVPRVSFQIIIPGAGGYFDPADKAGLAGYTAQMMREGTATLSSVQLSQELETIAGAVNVSAGFATPNASMSGGALTEHFDRVFQIAADVLLTPSFPADEWERFKTREKAQLQQQRTQPAFLSRELFSRIVYGNHPASRISATMQGLDVITREALAEFHRTRYLPDHGAIAIAGDISLAEARSKVEAMLGRWKKTGSQKPVVADPPAAAAPKVYLVSRPGSVQTTFVVGMQSMTRLDPDYEELTVANRVLGGTMGRLFRHLREGKGYTYGIGSGFSATGYRGDWSASTSVRTEVTEPALTDLLAEIAEMRDKPVPADELADVKRAIVASFALSLENPQSVLGYYTERWLYGLPADYWDRYPARISAVTAAEAQAAARKYWDPARLQIVAVGDATKIAPILEKKGELQTFDADGQPVQGPRPVAEH